MNYRGLFFLFGQHNFTCISLSSRLCIWSFAHNRIHTLGYLKNSDYMEENAERFRAISNMIEELKHRKANILQIRQEQEQIERRVHAATAVMNTLPSELTEWDDNIVYQMLEKVSVLSREKIRVTFRGGTEIEQTVNQPKRRKFA